MSLLQKIKDDQLTARKNREAEKASLLTTLLGEAANIGKSAGNRETTDEEVVQVVRKFLKGVHENIKLAGGIANANVDWLNALIDEQAILEAYLPTQLTADQIKAALAAQPKNKGAMMKFLKDNFAGQYDGKVAAAVVDELLKA